jgi:hypothetical protein
VSGDAAGRPTSLHHHDRDGRPGRRPGIPRLRQGEPVRRVLRHARRAGLPAAAPGARAHRGAGRRGADGHEPAAVCRSRCPAVAGQTGHRLRQRPRVQRGVSRPGRARAEPVRAARREAPKGADWSTRARARPRWWRCARPSWPA